jgi:uncharacterized protein (UPF0332 family)
MATKVKIRAMIKKLEREFAHMISTHRSLRDVHKHKKTLRTKQKASAALRKADQFANRIEKLKSELAQNKD